MRRTRHFLALLLCGLLSSCALTPEQQAFIADRNQQWLESRPKCYGQENCERMWVSAQSWVATRCGMKIQTATDAVIQTYTAVDGNLSLHCSVVKEPIGSDGYILSITTGCGNLFGCAVDPWAAAFDFNRAVQASVPLSTPAE